MLIMNVKFNVMGVAKVCGNLALSWALAWRLPTMFEVVGVTLALAGTCCYASASSKKDEESVLPTSQPREKSVRWADPLHKPGRISQTAIWVGAKSRESSVIGSC